MRQERKHTGEMAAGLPDRFGDRGAAGYRGPVGDGQMPGEIGGAANHAEPADPCTAGNRGTARDHGMRADPHVMRDLDLVVELAALLDDRVRHRTAVDRGIGADLHVVAEHRPPRLRNLHVAYAGRADIRRKTKAVGTDHHATVEDIARAHHAMVIDRDIGVHQRVIADLGVRTDKTVADNAHALAQPRARLDHHVGADKARGRHHGIRRHAGTRIDTGAGIRIGTVEALRDTRKTHIRIARHEPVAPVGMPLGTDALKVGVRHDDRPGSGGHGLRQVQRIGKKRQIGRTGLIEGSQATHGKVGITHNLRAVLGGELTQCGCLHGGTS